VTTCRRILGGGGWFEILFRHLAGEIEKGYKYFSQNNVSWPRFEPSISQEVSHTEARYLLYGPKLNSPR
jgi:hypothetical protein